MCDDRRLKISGYKYLYYLEVGGIMSRQEQIKQLEKDWAENPRWANVKRDYSAADVIRLRGSAQIEHTLARRGD